MHNVFKNKREWTPGLKWFVGVTLALSLLALAALCVGARAQSVVLPGFPPGVFQDRGAIDGASGPSPAYSFIVSYAYNSVTDTNTQSVNFGATANYYVVVALGNSNGSYTPTVTVCGNSLSQIAVEPGGQKPAIFAGAITGCSGSQNVVTTWSTGSAFTDCGVAIWQLTNLNSDTAIDPENGAGTSITINNTAGDFLFAYAISTSSGNNFSGSTETPTRQDNITPSGGSGTYFASADWITTTTNSMWAITPSGYQAIVGSNWH
jgi:hypothetical protein